MPPLSRTAKQTIAALTDALAVTACLWLAVALRYGSLEPPIEKFYWVFPIPALIALPLLWRAGVYRAVNRYMGSGTRFAGVRAIAIAAIVLAAVIYFRKPFAFPRSAPPIFFLVAAFYFIASRSALQTWQRMVRERVPRTVTAIYGSDDAAMRVADALRDSGPYRVVAFVDHDPRFHGGSLRDLPVLAPETLRQAIDGLRVDTVLLTYARDRGAERSRALAQLAALPVRVRGAPALAELVSDQLALDQLTDIDITDLLGRDIVPADPALITAPVQGRVVLVTGAAGSIGSELARQILLQRPARLLLLDRHEHGLYELDRELSSLAEQLGAPACHDVVLGDVLDEARLAGVLRRERVVTLFHAAAYKHVPLVEANVAIGVHNNVFGTLSVANAAIASQVPNLIVISTDKAVRPHSVMGASKRVAEMCLQALARDDDRHGGTTIAMVRFGNVLRSSGSVVPKFEAQIRAGGPITVTHPDVTRYFMSLEEAAQLVIQAAALARGGDLFLLDMGEPVRIDDLARRLIRLAGHRVRDDADPDGDIAIAYTGLRPGEKLYEELLIEPGARPTTHPKIMRADEPAPGWTTIAAQLDALREACLRYDDERVVALLRAIAHDATLRSGEGGRGEGGMPSPLPEQRSPSHDAPAISIDRRH